MIHRQILKETAGSPNASETAHASGKRFKLWKYQHHFLVVDGMEAPTKTGATEHAVQRHCVGRRFQGK